MNREEVRRYLDVSLAHSIVIDVREVGEAPGYLRSITIHRDYCVTIEFQKCSEYIEGDIEGSGLKFVGEYDTLENAIGDLEEFVGQTVEKWVNYTEERYLPVIVVESEPAKNLEYFEHLVRINAIPLPERGRFQIAGIYWRHVRRYGEYRPDKLLEEQELLLAELENESE
jgi:hypothetical protein